MGASYRSFPADNAVMVSAGRDLLEAGNGASVLGRPYVGFLPSRERSKEEAILHAVPRIQARKVPPLFSLQSMRPEHGPPLPLD